MAFAANVLINCGGGMVAVENGKVLSLLELPIAGLLSTKPALEVADALKELENAWRMLGSGLVSPFMTMSLLSLAVIPEIRITDKGIVDVLSGTLVPLFV
jgi:adenine deaminase